MHNKIRLLAITLLLINGMTASYGGASLMADPSGEKLGLPVDLLRYSLFDDYFFPGLLLLVFNGVLSMIAAGACILKRKQEALWMELQGIILLCWLIIQISILQVIHALHGVIALMGVLLIVCGYVSEKAKRTDTKNNI